jgi:CubicO group peptidase (beta-lactamase class C family)
MNGPIGSAGGELEAALASFVRDHRLPGAVAGVVHGDELAWSAGVGFADLSTRQAPDATTLFRIASITKTVTGTAIMALRDAGRLGLDDPAVGWLPELRGMSSPFAPVEALTIRRMLSHESGLPAEPPGTDWSVPVYQGEPDRSLARAADIVTEFAPHRRHKYSDLAYQLLGEIVTRASGVAYPEYVQDTILDPLGMSATRFEPLAGELAARCATGYAARGLSDELGVAPGIGPAWAEGGLWSNAEDLARWMSFQLRAYGDLRAPGEEPADSLVLAASSLREMHQPRYLADDGWTQAWGISWFGRRRDNGVWILHSGWLPGFSSTMCFDPVLRVGAIALVNGTGFTPQLTDDLAQIARRQVQASPPGITPPAPMPGEFGPLLGIYARPDLSWLLRLEWRDGKLTLVSPEGDWHPALARTGDRDVFTIEPGSDMTGDAVTFQRRPDGRVASVFLMDSTFPRLDPVTPGDAPAPPAVTG